MTDDAINALVFDRDRLRASGNFEEADAIKRQLFELPERVKIQDFKFGTRWHKTRLSLEEREMVRRMNERIVRVG